MPLQPPPSRYRVIERGRRLEVIDTRADASPDGAPPPLVRRGARDRVSAAEGALSRLAESDAKTGGLIERTGFDGRAVFATRRWFDDKAPRRLALDPEAVRRLETVRSVATGAAVLLVIAIVFQPAFALLLALPASPRLRARLRARATAWLDRFSPADQPEAVSIAG